MTSIVNEALGVVALAGFSVAIVKTALLVGTAVQNWLERRR
jgi:hypothetical protein